MIAIIMFLGIQASAVTVFPFIFVELNHIESGNIVSKFIKFRPITSTESLKIPLTKLFVGLDLISSWYKIYLLISVIKPIFYKNHLFLQI
jgi:hypothetical protein